MRNSLVILILLFYTNLVGQTTDPDGQTKLNASVTLARPVMLESVKPPSTNDSKDRLIKKQVEAAPKAKKEESKKTESESPDKVETPAALTPKIYTTQGGNIATSDAVLQTNQTPEFWYNSYTEKRNTFLLDDGRINISENKELDQLVAESSSYIKGTFYWNFLQARQQRNENAALPYLTAAQKQSPGNALLNPELAWQAERRGNRNERDEAVKAYANQSSMSAVQVSWANWILNAAPDGALIISNGEFDTYPLWLKQGNRNVFILSLAMAEDPAYLTRILHEWDPSLPSLPKNVSIVAGLQTLEKSSKPVFLCMSVSPELMKPLQQELFPLGPVLQLSKTPVSNLAELRKFYTGTPFTTSFNNLNKDSDPFKSSLANLLPGLLLLKKNMNAADQDLAKIQQLQTAIEKVTGKTAGQ